MMISWRKPAREHSVCCLPCVVCNTCLVLLSIPPTLCFGWILAAVRTAGEQHQERRRIAAKAREDAADPSTKGRAPRRADGAPVARVERVEVSFADERGLWLRALHRFFRGSMELQHLGPTIWRFLDDQPRAARVAFGAAVGTSPTLPLGSVHDFALRSPRTSAEVASALGDILALLPGSEKRGGAIASADGNALIMGEVGESGPVWSQALVGHTGPATCIAEAGEWRATGSSDCTVVLWQDGRCLRAYSSYEWSEWVGTINLGHITTVSAVCVNEDGEVASGDIHGSVALWRPNGTCRMMSPSFPGGLVGTRVAALAMGAGMEGEQLLVAGSAGGMLNVVDMRDASTITSIDVRNLAAGGGVLAASFAQPDGESCALIVCTHGLIRLWLKAFEIEEVALLPWPATGASIVGGGRFVTAWHDGGVAILDARSGYLRDHIRLNAPGHADVRVVNATVL